MFVRLRRFLFLAVFFSCLSAGGAGQPKIWEEFSGDNAYALTAQLVALGPRPPGSEAIEKARELIEAELKSWGWEVARQTFTAETPRGLVTFVNLIAQYRPNGVKAPPPSFLLCSHYDTKVFDTIQFVGANDGGSSTGLLIEMARLLAQHRDLALKTELVFFDGEEAYENFTEKDGFFGSRYFARQLSETKQAKQFKGGLLFDMVGDKSLGITLSPDTPAAMARDLFAAADALKLRNHFTYFDREIGDDHTALNAAGIPTMDLIDFDYPPWHTADDTMDKLSPESLRIVGSVALYYLSQAALK